MSVTEKTEYILTDTGFVRRYVSETPLSTAETQIANSLSGAAMDRHFFARGLLGGVVHLRITRDATILAQHIPNISLTTHFRPLTNGVEGYLVPTWGTSESEEVKLDGVIWTPDPDVRLWFVTRAPTAEIPACYLVATQAGGNHIRALPLPNTYEEGKLCMGDGAKAALFDLLQDGSQWCELALHNAALEHFRRTEWNTDLAMDRSMTDPIFRFDFEGKQLALPDNWFTGYCRAVSSDVYNWLAKASTFLS